MRRWCHGHGEGTGLVVLIALIVLVVGSLIGLLSGLIISVMNVSASIVTLGTWGAFFSLAEWLSVTSQSSHYHQLAMSSAMMVLGSTTLFGQGSVVC